MRAAELMQQPHGALPHDDHFHVRIGCPAHMSGCVENPTRASRTRRPSPHGHHGVPEHGARDSGAPGALRSRRATVPAAPPEAAPSEPAPEPSRAAGGPPRAHRRRRRLTLRRQPRFATRRRDCQDAKAPAEVDRAQRASSSGVHPGSGSILGVLASWLFRSSEVLGSRGCIGTKETGLNKVFPSAIDAVRDIPNGATLLAGGFGLCGIPENCIRALRELGTKGPHRRLQQLRRRRLRPRHPPPQQADREDGLELRRREQGVRAPVPLRRARGRAHAAGHARRAPPRGRRGHPGVLHADRAPAPPISDGGLPIRYAPDGTRREATRRRRRRASSTGARYVLEPAIRGDFAIVKAWKGDRFGNLVYRHTAMNFNPMMATAAEDRPSPRSRSSSRSASSIRITSTRPASSCTASSRARATRSASSAARRARRTVSATDQPRSLAGEIRSRARAPRRSCATATTSTSASACRRSSRTSSRRGSRSSSRARTACSASAPTRRRGGRRGPHQRGQGDRHDAPGQRDLLERRELRDDPRRPHRPRHPRRHAGRASAATSPTG